MQLYWFREITVSEDLRVYECITQNNKKMFLFKIPFKSDVFVLQTMGFQQLWKISVYADESGSFTKLIDLLFCMRAQKCHDRSEVFFAG